MGRRTAPFPPFLIPNRVPHGFTQDPSTDYHPSPQVLRGALRQSVGATVDSEEAMEELEAEKGPLRKDFETEFARADS